MVDATIGPLAGEDLAKHDRLVLGHHGTTTERADAIFDSGFKAKRNEYDWLGHGVYFFENSPTRAMAWANEQHPDSNVCVMAAEIALGRNCLDLADPDGVTVLESFFKHYVATFGKEHVAGLKETSGNRQFSCRVINWCCKRMAENGWDIHVIRSPFEEGDYVFSDPDGKLPTALLRKLTHIQLAVRDCCAIRRFWLDDQLAAEV